MSTIQLKIYKDGEHVQAVDIDRILRIGRQDRDEPRPFGRVGDKIVVAASNESNIARKQATIELLDGLRVRITNQSKNVPIDVEGYRKLGCEDGPCEFSLGVLFSLPYGLAFRVEGAETDSAINDGTGSVLRTLAEPTTPPGHDDPPPKSLMDLEDDSGRIETAKVVDWLRTAINLLQFAATSDDFYLQAAKAVHATVHLDFCKVLEKKESGALETVAEFPQSFDHSQSVVNQVCYQKRTILAVPGTAGSSVNQLEAVAAAPILNRESEVVGVLYGERRTSFQGRSDISGPEGAMVEVIAKSVAAGVARQDREKEVARKQVMFEQFFTTKMAAELEAKPELLDGKEQHISVLFVDIRDFSAVSQNIGPQSTMRWINGVMDVLSECVIDHDGVLVDYIGDELMAMWGAPDDCQDHTMQACLAATDMMRRLPEIDRIWAAATESPTKVGIGINSGPAFVGNSGSKQKFKYGPLGNTVNVGSRVQGATKHLGTSPIITGATRDGLRLCKSQLNTRRLCKVRVVGITEPIDLYELETSGADEFAAIRDRYEQALTDFEARKFQEAIRELANLHTDFPSDRPTIRLLSRAVSALADHPTEEHPIWVFGYK